MDITAHRSITVLLIALILCLTFTTATAYAQERPFAPPPPTPPSPTDTSLTSPLPLRPVSPVMHAVETEPHRSMAATTVDCAAVTEIPQGECEALVTLYTSMNGEGWTNQANWLLTNTPCSWYGIICADGHVSELFLWSNNLGGSLPPGIEDLAQLTSLGMQDNQISGVLPSQLGNLSALRALMLWGNQFTGTIPTSFGDLTNLQIIWLSYNTLEGPIPPQLGNLINLQELDLYTNELNGILPSELANLSSLRKLSLGWNDLTGTIPPSLGDLTNLEELNLSGNPITGTIPSALSNLANLQELHLYDNDLSGTIPNDLTNLSNLRVLSLAWNQLTDTISPQLENLANLEYLNLSGNPITGTIPSELGNLTNLRELHLYDNDLSGTIPVELANLENLQTLVLAWNQLTGPLPTALASLNNLQSLEINNNPLIGALPTTFTNLTQLTRFYFNGTNLCEPDALTTWLAGIENLSGTNQPCSVITVTLPSAATGAPAGQVRIPVTLSDTVDGLGIIAYTFHLSFDPTVLNINRVDTTGTLSDGWTATVNTDTPGEVQIVAFHANSLSGSGILLDLVFDVVGTANSSTALTWLDFVFNEGNPTAQTIDGFFTALSWTIGGQVYYQQNTGRAINGVTLDLSGGTTAQTMTDGEGYSFTVTATGAHTVTPSYAGPVNGISAFDAAYIAQCVAGLRDATGCPLLAADTSGNGSLSGFDAALIAQYAAGLAGPTSRVGTWVFAPASRSYAAINGDLTAENFGTYLIGDVTGNWSAPAAAAAQSADTTQLTPPLAIAADGSDLTLHLSQPHSDLLAFQVTVVYDADAGSFVAAQPTGALAGGWELVANEVAPGTIVLVGYGTTPVDGDGALVTLHFQATEEGKQIKPTIIQAQRNEEPLWIGQTNPAHQQFLPLIVN